MNWQEDVYTAAMAATDLTDVIGDRFFWEIADGTSAAPYIVAQELSDAASGDLSGSRTLALTLVQLACWATTKAGAVALASLVKANLEGRNLPGDSNTSLSYQGTNSNYDPETGLFAQVIDYRAASTID